MKRRHSAEPARPDAKNPPSPPEKTEEISEEAFERYLRLCQNQDLQSPPTSLPSSASMQVPNGNGTSSLNPAHSAPAGDTGPDNPSTGHSSGTQRTTSATQKETEKDDEFTLSARQQDILADGALIDASERYTTESELGRGGMGIVWRVWDRNLDRPVAKKILHLPPKGDRSDAGKRQWQLVDRFFREAKITGQLAHPGVVPVHELGRDSQGNIFFTMRDVSGTRLDKVFRLARQERDGWNQTRVLNVLIRVCDTLAYAHSKGVIHRDLKPANIMVGNYGETYVMDWGAAKFVGERERDFLPDDETHGIQIDIPAGLDSDPAVQTLSGQVLGTPPYMPPEQADGLIDHLDERSDIYSVGAMLYELLAGAPPYLHDGQRHSSKQLVREISAAPPPEIGSLNRKAPTELAAVCEKAMARRQGDRYASMDELAEDLRRFLENRVVRAYRTGAAAELRKWVRRNRGVALATAAAAATAVAGLVAIIATESQSKIKIREAFEREYQARKVAESLHLASNSSTVLPENPTLSFLLASEAYRRDPSLTARNALYAALQPERESRTLLGHTAALNCAAISPDGKWIISGAKSNVAALWSVETGRRSALLLGHSAAVTFVTFSSDSSIALTASEDGSARAWDVATGSELYVCRDHSTAVTHAAFSTDGQYLATTSWDHSVRIYNARTGALRPSALMHSGSVQSAIFHPRESRILATATHSGEVALWDLSASRQLAHLDGPSGKTSALSFSADGTRILTASRPVEEVSAAGRQPAFGSEVSPHATLRIWACDLDELLGHPETTPRQLNPLHQLDARENDGPSSNLTITAGAISADGERVIAGCSDGRVLLWTFAPNGVPAPRKLPGHTDTVLSAAFGPGDDRLLTLAKDNSVRVWHPESGRLLRKLDGHTAKIETACFDPHGRFLLTTSANVLHLWSASGTKPVLLNQTTEDRKLETHFHPSQANLLLTVPIDSSQAQLWNIARNELVAELEHDALLASDIAHFSHDGSRLVTQTRRGRFFVWDGLTGAPISASPPEGRAYRNVQLSTDGSFLMAHHKPLFGGTEAVDLWRYDRAKPVAEHVLAAGTTASVVHGTSKVLLSTARTDDRAPEETTLYDLQNQTGIPLPGLDLRRSIPIQSGGGKRLVTFRPIESPRFQLWDLEAGDQIPIEPDAVHQHNLSRVEFSPDSSRFFTLDSHRAKIWEAASGKLLFDLALEHPAENAFFSPNGAALVVTSKERGGAVFCSFDSKEIIWELGGMDLDLKDAAFSPDGSFFAGRLFERNECALFRADTGQLIAYLGGSSLMPSKPRFSPDGKWLATGDTEGRISFWPTRLDDVLKQPRPRGFTPDEVELYRVRGDGKDARAYRLSWSLERALEEFELVHNAVRHQAADPGKALEHCTNSLLTLHEGVAFDKDLAAALQTSLREFDNLARRFRTDSEDSAVRATLLVSQVDALREELARYLDHTPGR